jgi:hypothetical protein
MKSVHSCESGNPVFPGSVTYWIPSSAVDDLFKAVLIPCNPGNRRGFQPLS